MSCTKEKFFFMPSYKSLSDLHFSVDERPTNTKTPVTQDPPKAKPEIPLTPACEESPETTTNPEPNNVPKRTRQTSGALDKAQKRVRRLSVPGNLLSLLTRRKSVIWNDDIKNQGNQEQQEVIVSQSEAGESETGPQATEDKGMENEKQPEEVKDGADLIHGEAEEKPTPESDLECKDMHANSHKNEEIQQKEDFSEKETLPDTEVKTSPDADQPKDEQCLSGPVEKDNKLGVPDLLNVLIDTLCLETLHLNTRHETKERCLHDYLDLAGHGTASKFQSTVELIRKPVVEVCVSVSVEKTSEEGTESVMQEDLKEDDGRQGQVAAKEGEKQKIPEEGGKNEEKVDVKKETENLETVKEQHFENAENAVLVVSKESAQAHNQQESELEEETKQGEPSKTEPEKKEALEEKESRQGSSPEEIQSAGNRDEDKNSTTDQSDEPRNLTETDSQNDSLANDTAESSELQTDTAACSETQKEQTSSEKSNGVSYGQKILKTIKQVSFAHAPDTSENSHSNPNEETSHTNGSLQHKINQQNDKSALSSKNEMVSECSAKK